MNLIRQPNGWTCQPAAYAMAMGVDLDTVLKTLGHDGGRIDNFNALSVVWTVACFAQAELALAAYKLGYAAIEVPAAMVNHNGRLLSHYPRTPGALMSVFAPGTRFVLTIQSSTYTDGYHCVAYEQNSDVYYDPQHVTVRALNTLKAIHFIAAIIKLGAPNGSLPVEYPKEKRHPPVLAQDHIHDTIMVDIDRKYPI